MTTFWATAGTYPLSATTRADAVREAPARMAALASLDTWIVGVGTVPRLADRYRSACPFRQSPAPCEGSPSEARINRLRRQPGYENGVVMAAEAEPTGQPRVVGPAGRRMPALLICARHPARNSRRSAPADQVQTFRWLPRRRGWPPHARAKRAWPKIQVKKPRQHGLTTRPDFTDADLEFQTETSNRILLGSIPRSGATASRSRRSTLHHHCDEIASLLSLELAKPSRPR